MIADTSRESFHATERKRVPWGVITLSFIKRYGPISDRALAKRMDKERAWVSARRNGLLKDKLVRAAGKAEDVETGQVVTLWEAVL